MENDRIYINYEDIKVEANGTPALIIHSYGLYLFDHFGSYESFKLSDSHLQIVKSPLTNKYKNAY